MERDINKCIKCGHEIGEQVVGKCPSCGSPIIESAKYYRNLNNERLIKMHPDKRLPIGFFAYCTCCGWLEYIDSDDKSKHIGCTLCTSGELFPIPLNEKMYSKYSQLKQTRVIFKNAFILYPDDRIPISKTTDGIVVYSEKSENIFLRINYIAENLKKIKAQSQTVQTVNKVKCPYCSSSNTSKIGIFGRSLSIGLFGFASGKIGKQWHCNGCGSNF
jgi:transposase-like protein/predicted RNA-binding Zn-ribbon protein involved in translation (DUF1610 family)